MRNISNTTIKFVEESSYDIYDDNKDIIWPTIMGIFVALALGWMICRYTCSSKERSPHIVRCCPKTLCKNIRLCCMCIFRIKNEQQSNLDSRLSNTNNKPRPSDNSIQELPLLVHYTSLNRPSMTQVTQQWPPPFVLHQSPSFPISISIPTASPTQTTTITQPKRHPLRRDSTFPTLNNDRRESSLWPFRTANAVFHKQTSEIKENNLFIST